MRQALLELVNGRTGVSVEMAIRLSKAFGSTPETWLGMQMAYDLDHDEGGCHEPLLFVEMIERFGHPGVELPLMHQHLRGRGQSWPPTVHKILQVPSSASVRMAITGDPSSSPSYSPGPANPSMKRIRPLPLPRIGSHAFRYSRSTRCLPSVWFSLRQRVSLGAATRPPIGRRVGPARLRKLVPGRSVKLPPSRLRRPAAPLLEEERHAGLPALVPQRARPRRSHRAGPDPALATHDHPVESAGTGAADEPTEVQRSQERLAAEETDGRRNVQQMSNPVIDRLVLLTLGRGVPRALRSLSTAAHDSADSRYPGTTARTSLVPSAIAPITTSSAALSFSSPAFT